SYFPILKTTIVKFVESFPACHKRALRHLSFHSYSIRPHACSGLPLTVAGLNLHRLRPALAASSRRREPDERSTLLSSTLRARPCTRAYTSTTWNAITATSPVSRLLESLCTA